LFRLLGLRFIVVYSFTILILPRGIYLRFVSVMFQR